MKWSKSLSLFVVTSALLLLGSATPAIELPSWWGANDGLTSNFTWTFDDSQNPTLPTDANAPFGMPVWVNGDPAPQWYSPGYLGVPVRTIGSFDLTLPNLANPSYIKHVYFQMDAYMLSDEADEWDAHVHVVTDPAIVLETLRWDIIDLGDNWTRHYYTFDFIPQPESELFQFELKADIGPTLIDNMMIGTHCTAAVPEPFSMLLAGPALALAFARRKRR